MKTKSKVLDAALKVTIVGLLFGYIIYQSFNQEYQLAYYSRYTIAEITEIYYSGHLVEKVTYTYMVNGKEYERGANKLNKDVEVGKRYYLKFSTLNPKYSRILQNSIVPDSIKIAPAEGWETLPSVDKE